jgi:hypothetical protein
MSNPFENRSTPANLRLLADQIERHDSGEDVGLPDYAFVIADPTEGSVAHGHRAMNDVFSLIGGLELEKQMVIEEIER